MVYFVSGEEDLYINDYNSRTKNHQVNTLHICNGEYDCDNDEYDMIYDYDNDEGDMMMMIACE